MAESTYEALPGTVLAYKKAHQQGRFDPAATEKQERKIQEMWKEVEERSRFCNCVAMLGQSEFPVPKSLSP